MMRFGAATRLPLNTVLRADTGNPRDIVMGYKITEFLIPWGLTGSWFINAQATYEVMV